VALYTVRDGKIVEERFFDWWRGTMRRASSSGRRKGPRRSR
jgi:hypothetical protein